MVIKSSECLALPLIAHVSIQREFRTSPNLEFSRGLETVSSPLPPPICTTKGDLVKYAESSRDSLVEDFIEYRVEDQRADKGEAYTY